MLRKYASFRNEIPYAQRLLSPSHFFFLTNASTSVKPRKIDDSLFQTNRVTIQSLSLFGNTDEQEVSIGDPEIFTLEKQIFQADYFACTVLYVVAKIKLVLKFWLEHVVSFKVMSLQFKSCSEICANCSKIFGGFGMINKPLAAGKIFAGSWLRMFGPEISFLKNRSLESFHHRNYFLFFLGRWNN